MFIDHEEGGLQAIGCLYYFCNPLYRRARLKEGVAQKEDEEGQDKNNVDEAE